MQKIFGSKCKLSAGCLKLNGNWNNFVWSCNKFYIYGLIKSWLIKRYNPWVHILEIHTLYFIQVYKNSQSNKAIKIYSIILVLDHNSKANLSWDLANKNYKHKIHLGKNGPGKMHGIYQNMLIRCYKIGVGDQNTFTYIFVIETHNVNSGAQHNRVKKHLTTNTATLLLTRRELVTGNSIARTAPLRKLRWTRNTVVTNLLGGAARR